jgi:hypothetical protein
MNLLVSLLLIAVLVAGCGGGDDDDDSGSSSTPASTQTQPTVTSAASPTAEPTEPESTGASPSATSPTDSGSGSGTGGQAPDPSTTRSADADASPTATERPRNVVTTPRPIATRPPQPTIGITQPTPTAESGSDLVVIYDDNFDDGDAGTLFVGTTDTGSSAAVIEGAYGATAPAGYWQTFSIGGTEQVSNGVMWGTVSLVGSGGAAGFSARQYNSDDGGYWLVICWIDSSGAAGCHENRSNEFVEILRVEPGTIAIQETNVFILSLAASGLYFEVNEQEVGTATVSDLSPGAWGLYVETYEGSESSAYFDDITVWDAGS